MSTEELEIVRYLGQGSSGQAYLTDSGKVLKKTTNEHEYRSMLFLFNNPEHKLNQYHCKIYDIWKEGNTFCILKEFIPEQLSGDEFAEWTETCFNSSFYYIMNDFTYFANVGKRSDGTIVCFDGLLSYSFLNKQ